MAAGLTALAYLFSSLLIFPLYGLQRSADILSAISDVVLMLDDEGTVLFVSDAVRRVLHLSQVSGTGAGSSVHGPHRG